MLVKNLVKEEIYQLMKKLGNQEIVIVNMLEIHVYVKKHMYQNIRR